MEQYGFVALLDVLGVSSYDIEQAKELPRKLHEIVSYSEQILSESDLAKMIWKDVGLQKPAEVITFADTILFHWPVKKDSVEMGHLPAISIFLRQLLYAGLMKQLPMRGALAVGEYIADSHTVIGPAVSDAHSWSEEADWFGVTLTPLCQFLFQSQIEYATTVTELKAIDFREFFVEYPVPLKNGQEQDLWALSWPYWPWRYAANNDGITPVGFMTGSLLGMPIPKGTESKYFNSLNFFKWYGDKVYPEVKDSIERAKGDGEEAS